jgi:uncharacterized protein
MSRQSKKYNLAKKPAPRLKYKVWLIRLGCMALVAAAVFFIIYVFWHQHLERGQYNVSDTYIGENIYRSLDLKLAAKATFPSAPLTIKQDLGVNSGIHESVFSFQVKDDSLRECGLMMLPTGQPPQDGYPVIILIHGYINPDRYLTQDGYIGDMEFYASQGFMVLKPDLRGQGDSLGEGVADSAYYSMAYNTDVMSLISAVKLTKHVNKSNINLWGHSMGAYIALRAAILSPDIKSAILLSGPVDSLQEMYLTYIPPSDEDNPYALATRTAVFSKYGTPAENLTFWSDASPIDQLNRVKAFIQIHVGSDDGIVPPRFSADLDAALNQAKIKHQYFVYQGGSHSLVGDRAQIYDRSLELMRATRPNSPPTT